MNSPRKRIRSVGTRKGGAKSMTRGEIRWYTFSPPDKRRPVLLLTRDSVVDVLDSIIVVPATRTVRGLPSEVLLSREDGLSVACALNFDHLGLAQRSRLGPILAHLPPTRWLEIEHALLVACGFRSPARDL